MDTEMFSNAPTGGGLKWIGQSEAVSIAQMTPQHVQHAQYQMFHGFKWVARAVFILLVIVIIVQFIGLGPYLSHLLTKGWWARFPTKTDLFTQKEGLQWLGASADVVRGDLENAQDSLADKAIKNANRVTDMGAAAVKSGFQSRERLTTPEEEALKKMNV